jgi:competence CoiA-like predicted nuclease
MQPGPAPHLRTPFGLKGGRMVSPVEVESGLECRCTCVGCGARLIAKKGAKLAWHFAHHVVLAAQSCVETAIHAAAKQVFLENNWLQVPEKVVSYRPHQIRRHPFKE